MIEVFFHNDFQKQTENCKCDLAKSWDHNISSFLEKPFPIVVS